VIVNDESASGVAATTRLDHDELTTTPSADTRTTTSLMIASNARVERPGTPLD
jgi:hypothetical protein